MKYFFLILAIITTTSAYAGWDPKSGKEGACLVEKKSGKRFYFCGRNTGSCAGYNARSGHTQKSYSHGDSVTSKHNDSLTYWCCNGTTQESGYFVQSKNWIKIDTVVTVQLETGTCNYRKQVNVCDQEESTPCTVPDKCPNGRILINDECVSPCKDGEVLESKISNKCVKCETTIRQGIVGDKCVKCDDMQFFDRKRKKCIEKSDLQSFSRQVMKKCYACPNDDTFKKCVELFNMDESQRKADSAWASILNQCMIKE